RGRQRRRRRGPPRREHHRRLTPDERRAARGRRHDRRGRAQPDRAAARARHGRGRARRAGRAAGHGAPARPGGGRTVYTRGLRGGRPHPVDPPRARPRRGQGARGRAARRPRAGDGERPRGSGAQPPPRACPHAREARRGGRARGADQWLRPHGLRRLRHAHGGRGRGVRIPRGARHGTSPMSAGQVIAAIAAVAIAVAAILGRRRGKLGGERLVLSLLAAVGLGVYASGLLNQLPDAKKVIEDLANALGKGTYALVGVMAFLETGAFVGLIAPGEFTVIIGGVIAGQGTISVILLLGIVWACCVLGDSVSFFVGRRLGRSFLERHGPRFKITHERLAQVDEYFASHGGKTILIGRFIGIVRAVAPFIAGASGLRYGRFLPYSIIGTGLWGSFYTLLGYFFY